MMVSGVLCEYGDCLCGGDMGLFLVVFGFIMLFIVFIVLWLDMFLFYGNMVNFMV